MTELNIFACDTQMHHVQPHVIDLEILSTHTDADQRQKMRNLLTVSTV